MSRWEISPTLHNGKFLFLIICFFSKIQYRQHIQETLQIFSFLTSYKIRIDASNHHNFWLTAVDVQFAMKPES